MGRNNAQGFRDPLLQTAGRLDTDQIQSATERGLSYAGPGLFSTQLPGGRVLRTGRVRGTSLATHPYKLFIRPKEGTPGTYEGGIEYYSAVFDSLRPDDSLTTTGLLSEDYSTGWRDLIANDALWLTIGFSSGIVSYITLNSWGESDVFNIDEDAWSGNDGYCEDDGAGEHQTSRILLAYTIAGDAGQPVPVQLVKTHLLLRNVIIDQRAARYPFPHAGGYLH